VRAAVRAASLEARPAQTRVFTARMIQIMYRRAAAT